MAYYIHFWTKDGKLERVPYATMEEAEAEVWKWERAEDARLNIREEHLGGFPGALRDKMATVITDENNQICPIPFWGMCFIFDLKHNKYVTNDNYWATRFEAASRGFTPENIVCDCTIWGCATAMSTPEVEVPHRTRDEEIVLAFKAGLTRTAIAEKFKVSYQTACRIIKQNQASLNH